MSIEMEVYIYILNTFEDLACSVVVAVVLVKCRWGRSWNIHKILIALRPCKCLQAALKKKCVHASHEQQSGVHPSKNGVSKRLCVSMIMLAGMDQAVEKAKFWRYKCRNMKIFSHFQASVP